MKFEDNKAAIEQLWKDPVGRTSLFFNRQPFHTITARHIMPYQLGVYLLMWGELYGFSEDVRLIAATGRGTGKTSTFQELNAADMACFMPYFLQAYHGESKPIDVTIIFIANVKKGAMQRLENVKTLIQNNPYLNRHLVDQKQWTKNYIVLRNGARVLAESASDRVRGYHSLHPKGRVIYLADEAAFWGGSACMDFQKFVEEIAEQSFGAVIGGFTTPYGKRGGAWWAWNNPMWAKFTFPTRMNPRADNRKLAEKVKRLLAQGRQVIVDQEIRGLFVDDAGLFFTMEIWLKGINTALDWIFSNQDDYRAVLKEVTKMFEDGIKRKGYFILGLDPNEGSKKAGADPFGISLTERVGRKYYNRFTATFNGRSHEEILKILKPLCWIYEPQKINFDGGGGYHTGPMVMLKNLPGVKNIAAIPESNQSIVGYMSTLRALMASGRYEQPPSDSLRESQMAMTSIGDIESDDYAESAAVIKFQTRGKSSGIPCDLAAMGLTVSRENVARTDTSISLETKENSSILTSAADSRMIYQRLRQAESRVIDGIAPNLASVGL